MMYIIQNIFDYNINFFWRYRNKINKKSGQIRIIHCANKIGVINISKHCIKI